MILREDFSTLTYIPLSEAIRTAHRSPQSLVATTHLIQSQTNALGLPLLTHWVCLRVSIHKEIPHEKTTITEKQ